MAACVKNSYKDVMLLFRHPLQMTLDIQRGTCATHSLLMCLQLLSLVSQLNPSSPQY